MAQVPGPFIAGALVPATMLTILLYFDHTVSSQLAHLPEFNLVKPPAYSYDLVLVGLFTIGCGLLGIPPVNGVLPQVACPKIILTAQATVVQLFTRGPRSRKHLPI